MRQVERARALLGVPWEHQGRNINIAIDCIGLLVYAFEIDAPIPTYSRDPVATQLEDAMRDHFGPPIPLENMRPGDAVVVGFGKCLRHVGIVGDDIYGGLSLIHTDSIVKKVVEHPIDGKWQARIREAYRR